MGSPPVLMQAVLTMQVSIYSFPYRPEHNTASRISLAIGSLATQLLERGPIATRELTSVAQSDGAPALIAASAALKTSEAGHVRASSQCRIPLRRRGFIAARE